MAKTVAEICNMALSHLGHSGPFIEDLASDQSHEAEVCNTFWETARDSVLSDFPWPFAMFRATLAEYSASDEPARDGWAHVYALPDDCLVPRKIIPSGLTRRTLRADEKVPFEQEKETDGDGSVLLCDLDAPVLFYTAKIESIAKFSAKYILALSYKLAELIAKPITGNTRDRDEMRRAYMIEISTAESVHMNSRQDDQDPETESIAARR